LPVRILADSASGGTLPVRAPDAQAWLSGVASTPPNAPALPSGASPSESAPLPEAAPDTTIPEAVPPSLVIDPTLKAPIPRSTPQLRIPARHGGRNEVESVELAVYVDPRGQVEVAKWAGGTADTALVRAAVECASAMTFYPAMRGGEAIGVWCRQRFDFTR
jgi:TonB family protein